jgi:serine/threonine protein kinase
LNFAVSGISPWGDNTKITKDVIYNRILQKEPDLSSLSSLQRSLVEKMMDKIPKSRPSADQALAINLDDKWSQGAKLKKQIEEQEKQREKEEKQTKRRTIRKKKKK